MKLLIPLCLLIFSSSLLTADEGKHLFILSGQSNMAGLNPEESFTPTVEAKFGKENVIVVKSALGGQPIRRWDKSWQVEEGQNPERIGDLYGVLMKAVKAAIEGETLATVTYLWMQGERDAKESLAAQYEASFKRMLAQVKTDLNLEELNFVIGRLSDFDMEDKKYPDWTAIREIQVALADASENGAWVDTDDLNDGKNRKGKEIKDDLHYSGEGYVIFGTRLAEKAIELIED
ncbi:MAG: sialate O-acetylesterase [Verrucomicrobiales bacterium]|nr:sialate O-acetylesterase [Verrucomicrobiales bacterium]